MPVHHATDAQTLNAIIQQVGKALGLRFPQLEFKPDKLAKSVCVELVSAQSYEFEIFLEPICCDQDSRWLAR